jgi:UDP-N-acetylmuramate--alanine ligase
MFDAFGALFRQMGEGGARLFLLPVYYAGGTVDASVTADMLAAALAAEGVAIEHAADYDALVERVRSAAEPGDVILLMGARDPDLPGLARRLVRTLSGGRSSC